MRRKRILAIIRKESLQIWRDPRSLLVVLFMPIMLMTLMGYGINLDCTIGIVVPQYFSRKLHEGGSVPVQAIIDATDNNTGNLVIGYAEQVVGNFAQSVQLDFLRRHGRKAPPNSMNVEGRTWFNEDLESSNFIVPGVVAIVMAVIGTFLTSLTIAREWERGTMEQLISTPASRLEIVGGKLVPYFAIGMADAAICAAISAWWYQVPFRGSLIVLFASSALFLMAVLMLGFMISAITKNQLAASQFSLITTFLPSFLLSGFAFPIAQMAMPIQIVTRILPARYYVAILKSVFLKGSGLSLIAGQMFPMLLFAMIAGFFTVRSFKKNLE